MVEHLRFTIEECHDLLRKVKGTNCKFVSHSFKLISESPVGFLGNHFFLSLKFINDDGRKEDVRFFVKTTPKIKVHAKYVDEIGVFKKEVQFFLNLLPQLQDATSFIKYPWSPRCYIAKDDYLVCDDLSKKNYKLAAGRGIFDLEHCIAAMKTLAEFHASTLIWEHENIQNGLDKCRIDELFPEIVKEATYIQKEGHTRSKWLTSGIKALEYLCKKMGQKEAAHRLNNIVRKAVADVGPSTRWCNVLSHGDLWANNFMFVYDDEEIVEHCSLVDFQLMRYAPCAFDVMCCLHLIASQRLRKRHLNDLINIYYERLLSVLQEKKIVLKDVMSRVQMKEACANYKAIALAEACLFGTMIWLPKNLTGDVMGSPAGCVDLTVGDRSLIVEKAFHNDNFFRVQMTDLLTELLECDVIE